MLADTIKQTLETLGIEAANPGAFSGETAIPTTGGSLECRSPIDGSLLATVRRATSEEYDVVAARAEEAFLAWRLVPAPRRGDLVRRMGNALRQRERDLATLVTLESGKILAEALGEVREMIDVCDFAVGQSRMLYGATMPSERPGHRLFEQWHPLGPVGVITAFNFPVAVWSWNAMIALVAGDSVLWKPSSKTPLCALAVQKILAPLLCECGAPDGLTGLVVGGGKEIGERLASDPRMRLVSATGGVPMGRRVGELVARRIGRSLLELGGNNAVVVTPGADLDLALRAILFGAVGTSGQRCTTIRRIIVHETVFEKLAKRLEEAYLQVRIGDPLDETTLMGPLIDREAVTAMGAALRELERQGGRILYGGQPLSGGLFDAGTYVSPCIAEAPGNLPVVRRETFAPIVTLIRYRTLEEAIRIHNDVPQGLTSAIFSNDLREVEAFLGPAGSDCGIANVNISTSGAEIGGAFGGEKETGGGRESGSDAWKAYMRRQTCTVNGSGEMPLAQGIRFGVD